MVNSGSWQQSIVFGLISKTIHNVSCTLPIHRAPEVTTMARSWVLGPSLSGSLPLAGGQASSPDCCGAMGLQQRGDPAWKYGPHFRIYADGYASDSTTRPGPRGLDFYETTHHHNGLRPAFPHRLLAKIACTDDPRKTHQKQSTTSLEEIRSSSEKDFDSRPRLFGTLFARASSVGRCRSRCGESHRRLAGRRESRRGYPAAHWTDLAVCRPNMSGVHRRSGSQDGDPAAAVAAAGATVNASSDPQSAHMVASPSLSVTSSTPLHVLAHASTQERKRSVSASAERPAKRKIVKVTRACDICKVWHNFPAIAARHRPHPCPAQTEADVVKKT